MDFLNNITGLLSVLITLVFGVYLSVKTHCFQFKGLKAALKSAVLSLFSKTDKNTPVTSKGAMCTALAATIGTGNIVGVSGAIALCGAGVVFWIAVSSVLAMIIKYAEIYVAVKYRKKIDGEYKGGTMYAVKYGLKRKYAPLGFWFAFLTVLASFGTGNLIQINTSISSVKNAIGDIFTITDELLLFLSMALAVFIGFTLLSGFGAVSKICEKIIPLMLFFYTAASLYIMVTNYDRVIEIMMLIVRGAFSPKAVTGGAVCSVLLTLKTGVVRGIVSNEAGMGSATIAHAAAIGDSRQEGELGIAEVFIDTFVSLLTAFVILLGNNNIIYGSDTGLLSVHTAFEVSFGSIAGIILSVFLIFFGVSSVLGWGAYGAVCAEFLWHKKGGYIYKLFFSAACVFGAIISVEKIWSFSEILNSLVSIPNVIAVFLLFKGLKKYD